MCYHKITMTKQKTFNQLFKHFYLVPTYKFNAQAPHDGFQCWYQTRWYPEG